MRLTLDDAAWSSPWRTRSVAEKALLSLGLLGLALLAPNPAACLLVAAAAFAAARLARVPWRTYLHAVAAPAVFVGISMIALVLRFGSPGDDALAVLGPIWIAESGVQTAVSTGARALAAVLAMLLLAMTTPMIDLLTSLRRLRVPDVLLEIAALMYRLLSALLESAATVREAQAGRLGYRTPSAARRSVGMLGAAILTRAWSQAERLDAGLAGRGYTDSLVTLAPERPVSWGFVTGVAVLLALLAVVLGMLGAGVLG